MLNVNLIIKNVFRFVIIGIILGSAFNSANAAIHKQRMEVVSAQILPEIALCKMEYKLAVVNCEGGQTTFTALHDDVFKLGEKVLVHINFCITPSGDFKIINILIVK